MTWKIMRTMKEKKQIILVKKYLYCNMQTLSRFMDVECAAGEDQEKIRSTTLETKENGDSSNIVAELCCIKFSGKKNLEAIKLDI